MAASHTSIQIHIDSSRVYMYTPRAIVALYPSMCIFARTHVHKTKARRTLSTANWVDFPLKKWFRIDRMHISLCVCAFVRLSVCAIEPSRSRSRPFWIQTVFHVVFSHGWLWSLCQAIAYIFIIHLFHTHNLCVFFFCYLFSLLSFVFLTLSPTLNHTLSLSAWWYKLFVCMCSIVCDECLFSFKWKSNRTICVGRIFRISAKLLCVAVFEEERALFFLWIKHEICKLNGFVSCACVSPDFDHFTGNFFHSNAMIQPRRILDSRKWLEFLFFFVSKKALKIVSHTCLHRMLLRWPAHELTTNQTSETNEK